MTSDIFFWSETLQEWSCCLLRRGEADGGPGVLFLPSENPAPYISGDIKLEVGNERLGLRGCRWGGDVET